MEEARGAISSRAVAKMSSRCVKCKAAKRAAQTNFGTMDRFLNFFGRGQKSSRRRAPREPTAGT